MAQGNSGAVNIKALEISPDELPFTRTGEYLGSKRFIELDQIHLREGKFRIRQGFCRRWYRTDTHSVRFDAGHRPRHQTCKRPKIELTRIFKGGDDASRSAVILPAGVAGGNGCFRIRLEHEWLEFAESVHRRIGPRVLIRAHQAYPLRSFHLHRNDRRGKKSLGLSRNRTLMGSIGKFVLLLAADFVFPAQVLGRLDHATRYRKVLSACGNPTSR